MKTVRLLIIGLAAALCAPSRFTTANAEPPAADPAAELAAMRAQLQKAQAALKTQGEQIALLSAKPEETAPVVDSELARLAKGAGLASLEDVSWRVRAGLSPQQAVDVAVAQIASDKQAADAKAKAEAETKSKKR